jgi:hypothetical protein
MHTMNKDDTNNQELAASPDAFDLGEWLGRRQAFAMIAGRCSAAEAECLHRIRDEKLYLARAADWGEFCDRYLSISKRNADRLIRNLEEFGPAYFHLSQLTRISPDAYRAIKPAITEEGVRINDEMIALEPSNSERLAKAIALLRPAKEPATDPPAPTGQQRLAEVGKSFDALINEIVALRGAIQDPSDAGQIGEAVRKMRLRLDRLELEIGR